MLMDSWAVLPKAFAQQETFLIHSKHIMDDLLVNVPDHLAQQKVKLQQYTWETMQLLLQYQPSIPNLPFILYKAKTVLPEYAEIDSIHNHWQPICQNALTITPVDGDHITMLQEPFVANIASLINKKVMSYTEEIYTQLV